MDKVKNYDIGNKIRMYLTRFLPENRTYDYIFIQLKYLFVYKHFITRNNDPFAYNLLKLNRDIRNFPNYKVADKLELKTYAEKHDIPHVKSLCILDQCTTENYAKLLNTQKKYGTIVVKGSVASGENYFIDSEISFERFKEIFQSCSFNYYSKSREIIYRNLEPKVFCEPFIADFDKIMDIKIHVFNGIPLLIQVDRERHISHKQSFFNYNDKLTRTEITIGCEPDYNPCPIDHAMKKQIDTYLQRARINNCRYYRVDFLISDDSIHLGEITFLSWGIGRKFLPLEENHRLAEAMNM